MTTRQLIDKYIAPAVQGSWLKRILDSLLGDVERVQSNLNGHIEQQALINSQTETSLMSKVSQSQLQSALLEKLDVATYDEQHSALRSQVELNASNITDHAGAIARLETDVTALQSNVGTGGGGTALYDLYEQLGAVHSGDLWQFGGVNDLTDEDMQAVFLAGTHPILNDTPSAYYRFAERARTFVSANQRMLLLDEQPYRANYAFYYEGCSSAEVVTLPPCYVITHAQNMFAGCLSLRVVDGYFRIADVATVLDNAFHQCISLESICIEGLCQSISLADCANLDNNSILYMIEHAQVGSGSLGRICIITLHPSAYARAIGDTNIVDELKNKSNILLTSA